MAVPLTLSSVPAQTPYVQYVSGVSQTVFPYPFEITQDSDLVCLINGVAQATDSGYTLSGQGTTGGGNLTFTVGQTAGTIITLYRNISIARITQLSQNGTFFSSNFNNEFNRIYLIMQQLQNSLLPGGNQAYALMIPNSNNPAPTTLLTPASYANKYLSFDANGNPTPAVLTSSGSVTQALVAGLLYPQTAAETAAGVTPTYLQYRELDVLRYGADPSGVNDSSTAFQAALNVAAKIGLAWVEVPNVNVNTSGATSAFYKCASLLSISSTANVGIIGTHGMPFVQYTGTAANTDGPTGAFFNFTGGNNESFGGVMNLNIDCNFLCAHGVYAPGILNVNFLVDNVKVRYANLDGFNMSANASGGNVLWQMTRCAVYPAVPTLTSGFSKIACVGRYPLNIKLDTNSGSITVRDFAADNGVSGHIAIQSTTTYGQCNIFLDHVRFEMNDTGIPCVVENFSTSAVPALWLHACEFADVTTGTNAGSTLVKNLSTSGGIRGPVVIDQMVWNGINNGATSLTNIYSDAGSSSFTLPYDSKLLNTKIELNISGVVGRLPLGTALNGSALRGQWTVDTSNHLALYQDTSLALQTVRFGQYVQLASPSGASPSYAGTIADTGGLLDNNNASSGTLTYTLPAISAVGVGWTSPLFEVSTTNSSITVTANGSDKIGAKSTGSSYVGTNVVGNAFQLVAGRNGWVITTAWPQANWT